MVTESKPLRLHLVICGQVQGVGFRFSAQRQARSLSLNGWVRNAPDGSVEAVVEGEAEAARAFAGWARTGPSGAVVDAVETAEESPRGEAVFRIVD